MVTAYTSVVGAFRTIAREFETVMEREPVVDEAMRMFNMMHDFWVQTAVEEWQRVRATNKSFVRWDGFMAALYATPTKVDVEMSCCEYNKNQDGRKEPVPQVLYGRWEVHRTMDPGVQAQKRWD